MIKTIPKETKRKKAKWLSEEGLQTVEKRREAKSKGEEERYTHLNAEFQRIGRRDKKAFFSDQCKEIEENSRMGKTRDLFKKTRDTKGTFPAKMVTILVTERAQASGGKNQLHFCFSREQGTSISKAFSQFIQLKNMAL